MALESLEGAFLQRKWGQKALAPFVDTTLNTGRIEIQAALITANFLAFSKSRRFSVTRIVFEADPLR